MLLAGCMHEATVPCLPPPSFGRPPPPTAGPSGSVCSYYLAKNGGKVALLDKEKFPRDKVWGVI